MIPSSSSRRTVDEDDEKKKKRKATTASSVGRSAEKKLGGLVEDPDLFRRLQREDCKKCCPPTDSNDAFNYIKRWQESENIQASCRYAAKLNIPLFPKDGTPQFVIGTTKHILAYFVFPEHFHVVSLSEQEWSMERNCKLIRCICINRPPFVHVVTTPEKLYDAKGNLTVTGRELCLFVHEYGYVLTKWASSYNVYFLFRPDLSVQDRYHVLSEKTLNGIDVAWNHAPPPSR